MVRARRRGVVVRLIGPALGLRLALALAAGCVPPAARDGAHPGRRVLSHDIDVDFASDPSAVLVRDTLQVGGRGARLHFLLDSSAALEEVSSDGHPLEWIERPGADGLRIEVLLPRSGPVALSVSLRLARVPGPVQLEERGGWYPTIPGGQEAEHRVRVTTGAGRSALATEHGPPTVIEGPYITKGAEVAGVRLEVWLLQADAKLTRTYLQASADHLREGVRRFGPYPYKRFVVVESKAPVGLGFAGFTLLGSKVMRLPFIPETSLKHELFHCWWGNGVLPPSPDAPVPGNWVEGLTSYLADHDGRPANRKQILRGQRAMANPPGPPLRDLTVPTRARAVGYGKAAMVFHMLSKEVGREAFDRALRRILLERLHRRTTWTQLLAAVEAEADQDLGWFEEQWINRAGGPALWLSRAIVDATGVVDVEVRQVQAGPPYRLRIPVELETPDGHRIWEEILLDEGSARARFSLAERPVAIRLDPEHDVFRTLPNGEIEASYTRMGSSGEKLIEHSDAGASLPLPFPLPAGVALTPTAYRIGGAIFDPREVSLFISAAHPDGTDRCVGALLAPDADRLKAAKARLRWYGPWSWAAFRGERNVGRGMLAAPGPSMMEQRF